MVLLRRGKGVLIIEYAASADHKCHKVARILQVCTTGESEFINKTCIGGCIHEREHTNWRGAFPNFIAEPGHTTGPQMDII